MHQPGPDGICPHCEATGLDAVRACDLKIGMLIQTRFNPGPYTEYAIGEIGMVETGSTFTTWSFRWRRTYRGDTEIGAYADSSFISDVVFHDYEYLALPPGHTLPPDAQS